MRPSSSASMVVLAFYLDVGPPPLAEVSGNSLRALSSTLKIEQVAEEAAFFSFFGVFVRRVVGVVDVLLGAIASVVVIAWGLGFAVGVAGRRRSARGGCGLVGGAFDKLVEFAAVEPYAATSRAIVDLYPLPLRHC